MDERTEQGLTRAELEDDEDLSLGYSVLRALAEATPGMVELEPGRWYISKAPDERGILWI